MNNGLTNASPATPNSDFLIFQTENGATKIEVRLQDETVWLTQRLMADLFQKDVRTVNEHIKNIFNEGELEPEATIRKFRIVRHETQANFRAVSLFLDISGFTPLTEALMQQGKVGAKMLADVALVTSLEFCRPNDLYGFYCAN